MPEEFECPHCNETFGKDDASYTVCLTCGKIFPPGVDWHHGPGVGEGDVFAECGSAYRRYSLHAAARYQRGIWEGEKATAVEKYDEAGLTYPWERDGFEPYAAPE